MREQLKPSQVEVWYAPTNISISERASLGLLSTEEKQRHEGFQFDIHRYEYLIAHVLLRMTLSRYAAIAPQNWEFRTNEYGKPFIAEGMVVPPLYFSLSHTSGMVACAVARVERVGVDVESISRRTAWSDVSKHFFAPAEVEYLSQLPEEQRRKAFFEVWTLKESFLKAIGSGLSTALDRFAIFPRSDGRVSYQLGEIDQHGEWAFDIFHPSASHVLATAISCPGVHSVSMRFRNATAFLNSAIQ